MSMTLSMQFCADDDASTLNVFILASSCPSIASLKQGFRRDHLRTKGSSMRLSFFETLDWIVLMTLAIFPIGVRLISKAACCIAIYRSLL